MYFYDLILPLAFSELDIFQHIPIKRGCMRDQSPKKRLLLQLTQRLDCLFVRSIDTVGRVRKFRVHRTLDTHNRPAGKRVTAHDALPRCLTERELHPKVCKTEQVVWGETDRRVVTGERSGDHIEPIGDAPHCTARVVVESVMECKDRWDVCEDWRREEVCVAEVDVRAKLMWFIDCTCVYKRGECRAQRVTCKPDVDPRPLREILAEARRSIPDCIADCIYGKSKSVG